VGDWLRAIEKCSREMRREILRLSGSREAKIELGVGAGGDVTKKIDAVAERAFINTLENEGFSFTLISEEIGLKKVGSQPSNVYVTLDPLDGSTNASRGLPFMAISIAVSEKPYLRNVKTGLVMDVVHNVVYKAERGRGAWKNGSSLKPSETFQINEAVIGIDFDTFKIGNLIKRLTPLLAEAKHLRHLGANALEMCYVADGTMDAFIELRDKLRTTDSAAAYLILKEAGALITTPEGEELDAPLSATKSVSFIASGNPTIHKKIMEHLKKKHN